MSGLSNQNVLSARVRCGEDQGATNKKYHEGSPADISTIVHASQAIGHCPVIKLACFGLVLSGKPGGG